MAIKRMPIGIFVDELEAALNRKDGYIMGSRGQDPKGWKTTSWWFTQYSGKQKTQALYWRNNAAHVWDCNGMSEGIYEKWSGVNINSKARYNYAQWCDPKGTGNIPVKYRVPGAAVFIHSSSAGYITHVGYLYKPVNAANPAGDWYVIEARGVMYGVVKTKLSQRGWNRWGLMTKYFDYGNTASEPVKKEEPEKKEEAVATPTNKDTVTITGDSVNIRNGPDTSYGILKAVKKGTKLERVDASGWLCVKYNNTVAWVSKQYVKDGANTATSLNVRKGPDTSYSAIGKVKTGYKFTVIDTNGWIPVEINKVVYWVSAKYAE